MDLSVEGQQPVDTKLTWHAVGINYNCVED